MKHGILLYFKQTEIHKIYQLTLPLLCFDESWSINNISMNPKIKVEPINMFRLESNELTSFVVPFTLLAIEIYELLN